MVSMTAIRIGAPQCYISLIALSAIINRPRQLLKVKLG